MTLSLFAPMPDGNPVIERIRWKTDVQIATDGTEQRTALRLRPWFEYSWHTAILPQALTEEASGSTASLYAALTRSQGASHPRFRIPLFPHSVRPNEEPTRGLAPGAPVLSLAADGSEVADGSPSAVMKVPTAEALLSIDRDTLWTTDRFGECRIDARVIDHFETGSSPTLPDPEALETMAAAVLRHDWAKPVEEKARIEVLKRETWNAFSERGRFEKRLLVLDVVAIGSDAIAALRAFLFACRGRLAAFEWNPPVPDLAGAWRLDQDVVEIAYLSCEVDGKRGEKLADTQLALVKV